VENGSKTQERLRRASEMYFQASNPNKKGFLASNQDDDTFFG
jgi:hypothetical protein